MLGGPQTVRRCFIRQGQAGLMGTCPVAAAPAGRDLPDATVASGPSKSLGGYGGLLRSPTSRNQETTNVSKR